MAIRDPAIGWRQIAAHLTDDPVAIAADWNAFQLALVVDSNISPVVLDDWFCLQHHFFMERARPGLLALGLMIRMNRAEIDWLHGLRDDS